MSFNGASIASAGFPADPLRNTLMVAMPTSTR